MALPSRLDLGLDPKLFLSTFALIFTAELPDKTAFATLLLATRNHPVGVFAGVAAAFVVQTLVAIAFGSVIALLPESAVKIGAAGMFFAFALSMWLRKEVEEEEEAILHDKRTSLWKAVASSFMVIFLAEWGDLTQLATAALEAKYRMPVTIGLAAVAALWSVTAIAIVVGHRARKLIRPELLQKVAAFAFAGVGIFMLWSALR
jgi:putative Ca2+/H+ antiporter (TMEM165/GDT1 family)